MMRSAGEWDIAIVLVLAASVAMYTTGLARLWRRAGRGRGVGMLNVGAFAGGIGALIVALLSPIDALSDVLFSAHMGQHELLMLVAAPLLVVGKPWLTGAWSLPERLRVRALARLQRPPVRRSWRAVSAPVTILVLHALALWIWHLPVLFEAAMRDERVHAFQHLGFFVTAALFWWALVRGRYGRGGYGAAALFVFLTAMHSGILGALITVAGRLVYPIYGPRSRAAGVDPLADQQLAGLLMWIPAGVLLAALALALFAAWLGEVERRARRESRAALAVSLPPPGESGRSGG
ncbi:MAG TPA: cytochrome c oxidase assembly protein [Polyangia bacterium]